VIDNDNNNNDLPDNLILILIVFIHIHQVTWWIASQPTQWLRLYDMMKSERGMDLFQGL
jgi:hypothetical protein